MSEPVVIIVHGEPHGKERPRSRIVTTRDGRQFVNVYTPSKTKEYERAIAWAGKAVMRGRELFAGPVAVTITAVFGVPKSWTKRDRNAALVGTISPGKPDWDNVGKAASDALNGIAWTDDSQATDVRVIKRYGEEPHLRIEIRELAVGLLASTAA